MDNVTDYRISSVLEKFISTVFAKETHVKFEDMENVQDENENLNITTNEQKVRNKLLQLQDIHPQVPRNCAGTVSKPLSMTFTKSLQEGILQLQVDWRVTTVCPMCNKGR